MIETFSLTLRPVKMTASELLSHLVNLFLMIKRKRKRINLCVIPFYSVTTDRLNLA